MNIMKAAKVVFVVWAVIVCFGIALLGTAIWVAGHFIAKFW